ncbi:hypothetical protein POSPLADRAFT_1130016 [Postia placenta MAD-698-R-SB12]|uniref:F-box domain-containing protein n=1 Tax=Postia placenta MAD-698-R-SB12 TaxID=670580 RepID=A0A1X6NHL5_9APHY|nr:hypothetical protein POSPLADRAFT_1130016 [Postia placenta MAD-698-R-SB12]OSX68105.1 hypothetical protein POSPLADRAFT_1130016 [Postia placenta MAD-698-R-SB12]
MESTPRTYMLDLDVDVMLLILAHLSSGDALRLAAAARALRPIALARAYSDVTLTRAAQTAAFCAHMLADTPRRPCSMRRLDIRHRAAEDEAYSWNARRGRKLLRALAALIRDARELRALALPAAEMLLLTEPHVGAAVASLPRLARLHLEKAGSSALGMLRAAQGRVEDLRIASMIKVVPAREVLSGVAALSYLRTLHLHCPDAWMNASREVLSGIASLPHLQTLYLYWPFKWTDVLTTETASLPSSLSLRQLHMYCGGSSISAEILARIYPNLEEVDCVESNWQWEARYDHVGL